MPRSGSSLTSLVLAVLIVCLIYWTTKEKEIIVYERVAFIDRIQKNDAGTEYIRPTELPSTTAGSITTAPQLIDDSSFTNINTQPKSTL
jgi:hypothetical protein